MTTLTVGRGSRSGRALRSAKTSMFAVSRKTFARSGFKITTRKPLLRKENRLTPFGKMELSTPQTGGLQ